MTFITGSRKNCPALVFLANVCGCETTGVQCCASAGQDIPEDVDGQVMIKDLLLTHVERVSGLKLSWAVSFWLQASPALGAGEESESGARTLPLRVARCLALLF